MVESIWIEVSTNTDERSLKVKRTQPRESGDVGNGGGLSGERRIGDLLNSSLDLAGVVRAQENLLET